MPSSLLTPTVQPPFPLRWGFSTRYTPAGELPPRRITQVHGCGILQVEGGITGPTMEADGLWTFADHTPIGVRVADCVPILLAGMAGDRPWISALHAGWRGAVAGILRHAVSIFKELDGRPEDLVFAFGPCIQPCHFEVGREVLEAARLDAAWHESLAMNGPGDRPCLDLHGFLRAQALDLGLDPAKDGSIRRCTYCELDTFYSYRRGEREDRQWGIVERV